MNKYKLLKDLPLYPAGTICEIREPDNYAESVFKVKADNSLVVIMDRVELRTIRGEGKFDEWFEEIDENKVWKPKDGSRYWKIVSNGLILHDTYCGIRCDKNIIKIGNCFNTREDAEKAVEKLKALRRLREAGLETKYWAWSDEDEIEICMGLVEGLNGKEYEQVKKDLDLLFKEDE